MGFYWLTTDWAAFWWMILIMDNRTIVSTFSLWRTKGVYSRKQASRAESAQQTMWGQLRAYAWWCSVSNFSRHTGQERVSPAANIFKTSISLLKSSIFRHCWAFCVLRILFLLILSSFFLRILSMIVSYSSIFLQRSCSIAFSCSPVGFKWVKRAWKL